METMTATTKAVQQTKETARGELDASKIGRQSAELTKAEAVEILGCAMTCLEGSKCAADLVMLAKERKVTFEPRHKVDAADSLLAQMVHGKADVIRVDIDDMNKYMQLLQSKGLSNDAAKEVLSIRLAPIVAHELSHLKTMTELESRNVPLPYPTKNDELISSLREASVYRELKSASPEVFKVCLSSVDKIMPLAADGGDLNAKMKAFSATRLKDAGPSVDQLDPKQASAELADVQGAVNQVLEERKGIREALAQVGKENKEAYAMIENSLQRSINLYGDDASLALFQSDVPKAMGTLKDPAKLKEVKDYYKERLSLEKAILQGT